MRRFLLFLLWTVPAWGSCTVPVISSPLAVSDSTGQQLTITWTTNVAADSRIAYGSPNPGTWTAQQDSGGVTSHSVTVTGLMPGQTYGWGIASQAISSGNCGHPYFAYYNGPGGTTITMHAAPAGSFTYGVSYTGGSYVTQGYGIYLAVNVWPTVGTYINNGLKLTVSGLPNFTSVTWPSSGCGPWNFTADTCSTTTITNDTLTMYNIAIGGGSPKELYLKTNQGGTTTPGSYTLAVTGSAANGSGYSTVGPINLTLHVISSTTPFSGTAFTFNTPNVYPAIPNVSTFISSADTYGQQTCAQDQDATNRIIRANDTGNLTPIGPSTTYASWYYDGVQVYYNIQKMLANGRNWGQCIANVKAVYRDGYVIPNGGAIQTFLMFSNGYNTDYVATSDGNDLTLLNDITQQGNVSNIYNAGYVDVSNLQREVAYVMRNELDAIARGQSNSYYGQTAAVMRDYAEDHVLGMIDQMCLTQNAQYYEFFMMGLQAQSLIQYWNTSSQDSRIPPALACLANWAYTNYWQANDTGAFPYDKTQQIIGETYAESGNCLVTLDNLISPVYAWLFYESANATYQTEGDAIFSAGALMTACGGTPATYLAFPGNSNGKNYSQQYYWGTNYLNWRAPNGSAAYQAISGGISLSGGVKIQ